MDMHTNGILDLQNGSPLTAEQAGQLNRLAESLTPEQRIWVSGYLAGLNGSEPGPQLAVDQARDVPVITVLYGSETGNARGVAEQVAEHAAARELNARVLDMADYRPRELKKEKLLIVVSATHGEGDPPDPAANFYEYLHSRKAPKLDGVKFAVLSLGDSSYEFFCQTGKDFDARLEELGGERLRERVDCDVDFDDPAEAWVEAVLDDFAEHAAPAAPAQTNVVTFPTAAPAQAQPAYDRKNPFDAEILDNLVLTGRGSGKETRHVELSLEGSGLSFEPGDILCVAARNRPEVVGELIEAAGLRPDEKVETGNGDMSLEEALQSKYEITAVTPPFLQAYAERAKRTEIDRLIDPANRKEFMEYQWGRHVIDVIQEFPTDNLDAQGLVGMLRKLQPREYSIASSHIANPDEVHLTVAAVRYHSHGRARFGVCSTFLCDLVENGDTVPVYVKSNKNFKLPADPSTPIIMVGPGTGVAPFRAFIEEREEIGADGPSWLFFGEQRFRTDFLYQVEWQRWLREGALTRMDVAFSRDQKEKVYVQHRMFERSRELFQWLEDGAYFYVCGDSERMAPDVDAALHRIVADEGDMTEEQAVEYVKTLQRDKRYQRDVY